MCGIVGYIGVKEKRDFLISGLRELEYTGYDSAGIAVLKDGFCLPYSTFNFISFTLPS